MNAWMGTDFYYTSCATVFPFAYNQGCTVKPHRHSVRNQCTFWVQDASKRPDFSRES
jgi:hypothetical protein